MKHLNACQAVCWPRRPVSWALCALALFLVGCPSRSGTQHGRGEQTVHARGALPGARAFVIERADQLLRGAAAEGRVGDLRLSNGEVIVIVGAAGHQSGFGASGGTILDAGLAGRGVDGLQQVLLFLDRTWPRQASYGEVKIVEAGGPGLGAVIEVVGQDTGDPDVAVTTRYALPATGAALTIETTIENRGARDWPDYELGDALQWGASRPFAPGLGSKLKGERPSLEWIAAEAEGVSYAYVGEGGVMSSIHGGGWSDLDVKVAQLHPKSKVTYTRRLIVGAGSVGDLVGPVMEQLGRAVAPFEVVVVERGGGPVEGAWVEIQSEDGRPFARFAADARGVVSGVLPAGEDFKALALARGRGAIGDPAPLKPGGERLTLEVTQAGRLTFAIVDGEGAALPGKVILEGLDGTPDPDLGPAHHARAGGNRLSTITGLGHAALAPGRYAATAARGPEYDLDRQEIVVEAGQETRARFALRRSIDTRGWLAADLHQHSARSTDSPVPLDERVISNIVEGVEILGSSDHNVVTDYGPTIAALGAGRWLATLVGDEVTTASLGHFNAFPLVHRPELTAGGALAPGDKTPAAIFEALRALEPEQKIIQINHPRTRDSGYFNAMGLARGGVEASDPRMSWGFDAIEVFSGGRVDDAMIVMEDWFLMLNKGGLFVATGNSDTHLVAGDEPGYARTMIHVGVDSPEALSPAAIVDALLHRKAVVTNGPMIDASLDGAPIGGFVAPAPGRRGVLKVKVQAARWIDVEAVEVISDKGVIKRWEGLSGDQAPIRLDAALEVPIGEPGWFVVRATGARPLKPVAGSHASALAFTNPIWIGALVDAPPNP